MAVSRTVLFSIAFIFLIAFVADQVSAQYWYNYPYSYYNYGSYYYPYSYYYGKREAGFGPANGGEIPNHQ
ncbi:hypothetical protein M3Y98_00571400 [Aphelenchoides besseyi]|nr:hypothetical protein M3Y98_00571400 [Aphelenchoides besseyi]